MLKDKMTRQLIKTISLLSAVFLALAVHGQTAKTGANRCSGVYTKSWAGKYKSLKKNNYILSQKASNSTDSKGLKQGLWTMDIKHNTHYGFYTCLDTVNHGGHVPFNKSVKILAKGNYKDNNPTGVWIKYIDKSDSTYYEYFFFKNGNCIKHVYFDHHNCMYFTDSLNATGDTLISNGNYYSTGKKEKFNVDYNWISPAKEKIIKGVSSFVENGNKYLRTQYYDSNGLSSSTVIQTTINDTLIVSTYNSADKIDRRKFLDKKGNVLKKEKKIQTDSEWTVDN
jgi:hypothetical protein